jgi:cobalt-precorrin-5B (C1)-methyltransferase
MSDALREPDLPRTAKVRTGPLRTGWTTGACTAAAAKAAAIMMAGGPAPHAVDIPLPAPFQGRARARFAVARAEGGDGWAEGEVVKDAGDDPDVTHGAHLIARLEPSTVDGVTYMAGDGVGTVTKPGLGLEVGAPAINPVPRAMIAAAIGEVLDLDERGVWCTVRVPGGQKMALKTTNRRLGIVGGISILGTTGVVRPFSTASWRASVVQAIDVVAANSRDMVVLTTGGRTERAAARLLRDVASECVIEVGDFTGAALRRMVDHGLERVVFVGMAGKLTKLASGIFMTHYTRSKVDTRLLAEITAAAGGSEEQIVAVRSANTARHAAELWAQHGLTGAPDLLCARVAANIVRFTGDRVEAAAVMVDFEGQNVLGASPGWRAAAGP